MTEVVFRGQIVTDGGMICLACKHHVEMHYMAPTGKIRCLYVENGASTSGVLDLPYSKHCPCSDYKIAKETKSCTQHNNLLQHLTQEIPNAQKVMPGPIGPSASVVAAPEKSASSDIGEDADLERKILHDQWRTLRSTPKRLRVFDLNTPFFWVTIFWYGRRYGKPTAEALLWPSAHSGAKLRFGLWWFNFWKWEPVPMEDKGEETISKDQTKARSEDERGRRSIPSFFK